MKKLKNNPRIPLKKKYQVHKEIANFLKLELNF